MRAVLLVTLAALCGLAANAGDEEFDRLIRGIESRYGVKKTSIPLFGVANLFVKVARPAGASDMKLAIFEDLDAEKLMSDRSFDSLLADLPEQGWRPFVRVESPRDRERVRIYSRMAGKKWELLISTFEPGEAVVMKVRLSPDALAEWIADPEGHAKSKHDE